MHQAVTKESGTQKLAGKARIMIDAYLSLPVGAKPSCPYFNNRRKKTRGGLRVLKGKGTPDEIAEECEIYARLFRIRVKDLSTDKLKEFLIEHNLGIDCSGFVYHVLNALVLEKNSRSIKSFVKPVTSGFLGYFRGRFRPAENTGVSSFRHDSNSVGISARDARPGDVITFIGTGKDKNYNHILVITGIDALNEDTRISYAHSYAWPSDGVSNHGVREGDILVHGDDLLGGTWKEQGVIGNANYTFECAKGAKEVSIRRFKF